MPPRPLAVPKWRHDQRFASGQHVFASVAIGVCLMFLTADFAAEQKLFVYGFNEKRNSWEIMDREFRKVKNKLLLQLTNFGQPIIEVVDGNHENRGELLLAHKHDGQDLKPDYARETLRNLQTVWRRPCNLVTKVEGKGVCLRFDGQNQTEKKVDL